MSVSTQFSEHLWSSIDHVYRAILDHPFVTGLTDGSLPKEAFRHYIVQDEHYLNGFSQALLVCGAKAPTVRDTLMFAEHAVGGINAEQEMHAELVSKLGESQIDILESIAPTTHAYVSYLLATVYGGSFAEALGAVLPCYWIYAKVGTELQVRSSPDPLYTKWISMYGGEDYKIVVDAVLDLTNGVGTELSEAELDRVCDHFLTSSRYEWMFWDAAYRQERWPLS